MPIPSIIHDSTPGDLIVTGSASNDDVLTIDNPGAMEAEAGDLLFISYGGRDGTGANTAVVGAVWNSVEFVETDGEGVSAGGATRSSQLFAENVETNTATPVLTVAGSSAMLRGHAGRITGAVAKENSPIGAELGDNLSNTSGATTPFTTTRPNSLILVTLVRRTDAAITPTSPMVLHKSHGTAGLAIHTLTIDAPSVDTYNIAWTSGSSAITTISVAEVCSVAENEPDPDPEFDAEDIRSHKLAALAAKILAPGPNVELKGDSLVSPWSGARHTAGFIKSFNHPNGWQSLCVGAGTSDGSPLIRQELLGTFDDDDSWVRVKNVNHSAGNEFWEGGAPAFHGSLPFGRTMVIRIGANGAGYTPDDGDALRWVFRPEGFDGGQVPNWFSGDDLVARVGLIMDANVDHPDSIELNGVSIDLTDAETFDDDTIADQAINFIKAEIPIDGTTLELVLGNISTDENDPVFLAIGCVQIIDRSNPNGLALAATAEVTWRYADHSQDAQATATNKRYRTADHTRLINSVFKGREGNNNIVFFAHGSQGNSIEAQKSDVAGMLDEMNTSYSASNLTVAPHYGLIATWRTNNDDRSRAQAQIFFGAADDRADASLVSIYGISEGIHLVGTWQEQQDWAAANGYDTIERINTDPLDVSEMRLIDSSSGIHQNGAASAFFFAWLVWQEIATDDPAPPIEFGSISDACIITDPEAEPPSGFRRAFRLIPEDEHGIESIVIAAETAGVGSITFNGGGDDRRNPFLTRRRQRTRIRHMDRSPTARMDHRRGADRRNTHHTGNRSRAGRRHRRYHGNRQRCAGADVD
jgi:hypothetical protein